MVVRHNDSQPVFLCIRDLLCRRDPIIAGHDRVNAIVDGPVDEQPIEPVPVFDPVRDICVHIRAESGQSFLEDISCIYAVDVIVPDHTDPHLLPDLLREDLHRPVHILHQHTVVQIRDRPVQIEVNGIIPDDIPVADQARHDRRDMVLLPDPVKVCFFHCDKPALHPVCLLHFYLLYISLIRTKVKTGAPHAEDVSFRIKRARVRQIYGAA